MLGPRSMLPKLMCLAALSWAAEARAFETLYSQNCTACHTATVAPLVTCNGCHAHGTHASAATKNAINIAATTDKASYAPGETVTVTVNGGYRVGWVRVNLYDEAMLQLARSSCTPGGMGGCDTSVFPATLTAPAPTTPGTYRWRAAWFGNVFEAATGATSSACGATVIPPCFRQASTPGHGEEIVEVPQFTVVAATAGGPNIAVAPPALTFGEVTLGASGTQTFTISNTGDATLTGSVVPAEGTSSEFIASPATFDIPAAGAPVTVTVTYTPTAAGDDSGTLNVTSNDPDGPIGVSVSGTGVAQGQPPVDDDDDDDGCSSGGSGGWLALASLALLGARRAARVRRVGG